MVDPNQHFADLMRITAQHALKAARDALREGQRHPFDHVQMDPSRMAPDEIVELLERIQENDLQSRIQHLDDPAIRADIDVHAAIEDIVRQRWPANTVVGGEEALDDFLESIADAPLGTLALNTDPIDGSRPYGTLRFGWAVVLQLVVMTERGWLHERAIIMGDSGLYLEADRNWLVRLGDIWAYQDRPDVLTQLGSRDASSPKSLALVAAKARDRQLFRPLFTSLPRWTIDTLGGNPLALGFASGDLGASISGKPTTTWDTCWVPVAASLGAVVARLNGEIIPLRELREWWDYIGLGESALVVPPLFVARPEYFDELLGVIDETDLEGWIQATA